MENINTKQKSRNLKLRLTELEFSFIKQRAEEAHLSISDYQRCKLFDESVINPKNFITSTPADNKARFACDHDKELMRLVYRSYLYSKEMAKKELGQKWFDEAEQVAELLMKDWGYE